MNKHTKLETARHLCAAFQHGEALARLNDVLKEDPDCIDALYLTGCLKLAVGELEEAAVALEDTIEKSPRHLDAYCKLRRAYLGRGRYEEAYQLNKRAVAIFPADQNLLRQLAWLCVRLGEIEEAYAIQSEILRLNPEDVHVMNQQGILMALLNRPHEGLSLLNARFKSAPQCIKTNLNLACLYIFTANPAMALWHLGHVFRQEPNNFTALWCRALVLLSTGQFDSGWKDYEFRFAEEYTRYRYFPFSRWNGESLEQKKLLIYSEQGLGDQIMFASCIPDVARTVGECVLECDARLETLFARSFPNIRVIGVISREDPITWVEDLDVDYQIAMGSLPLHFRRCWADFPAHSGYLVADAKKVGKWRARLDDLGPGVKIGISWRGGIKHTRSGTRSIDLDQWQRIFGQPHVHFISLQYGMCADELAGLKERFRITVHHWQEAIDDYDETAALVCALDQVISVCTSLVHLTGALGRPAWVLVPYGAEWRYLWQGDRMPWYPSVKLFRQPSWGDWPSVWDRIAEELTRLAVPEH